jgi:prepilin-type N-terminal cleavage/methylation domain-containing protein
MTRKGEQGFTYIETLIAMFILAVGAMALAQLFFTGVQTNARTKGDTEIATVAQKYVERLYQQSYDELAAGVGGSLTVPTTDYCVIDVKLENSGTVSNPAQFHQNEVLYDIYWQIAHCGNATPTDACTSGQLIAGLPWVEISVRVVNKRIPMGARGGEVTVRVQKTQII